MDTNVIDCFYEDYEFLSNFYYHEIYYNGYKYFSVEHGIYVLKCEHEKDRNQVLNAKNLKEARKMSKNFEVKKNWNEVKNIEMKNLLRAKFRDVGLRNKLDETKGKQIIVKNNWHDVYWGVCVCKKHCTYPGKNVLGVFLMSIRDEE